MQHYSFHLLAKIKTLIKKNHFLLIKSLDASPTTQTVTTDNRSVFFLSPAFFPTIWRSKHGVIVNSNLFFKYLQSNEKSKYLNYFFIQKLHLEINSIKTPRFCFVLSICRRGLVRQQRKTSTKASSSSRSPLLATPVVRISLHFMIVRLESLLTAKFISRFIGASSHRYIYFFNTVA
jgi:hypothetical protein